MEEAAEPAVSREERLRCWIDAYSDAILRTCFLYLSDAAQAEDALQETWLKAWRAMDDYERKGVAHDKAWLMRIAINTCKDIRRTAWFRHVDSRKAIESLPPPLNEGEPDTHCLSLLVMELPARYRQVVLLYYFQGLTQRETAQVLGISPAAVLRRLRSAEKILKQSLMGDEA